MTRGVKTQPFTLAIVERLKAGQLRSDIATELKIPLKKVDRTAQRCGFSYVGTQDRPYQRIHPSDQPERDALLRAEAEAGVSRKELAQRFGMKLRRVSAITLGIPAGGAPRRAFKEAVFSMADSGKTVREIAATLGCTNRSVKALLAYYGMDWTNGPTPSAVSRALDAVVARDGILAGKSRTQVAKELGRSRNWVLRHTAGMPVAATGFARSRENALDDDATSRHCALAENAKWGAGDGREASAQ